MDVKKAIFTRNEINLVVGFFAFLLALLLFTFYSPNYYDADEPIVIEIPKGATLNSVVDSLYSNNVISNKSILKITAFLYGAETKIKHGTYDIPNGLSYVELVELLIKGVPNEQIRVTIPEGIWQESLANLLEKDLKISKKLFLQLSVNSALLEKLGINSISLEGYLLPETYYFYPNTSAESVIKKLHSEMENFLQPHRDQMAKLDMTENQILTLASIIEGETSKGDEYKIISGVYHNRLKKGMALQADPTIQYLVRHKRKNKVYFKDLEIDSPFNTYKYTGLPPGPINNPGKQAIVAALYPDENDYYFFVADGTGGHAFAETYSEHQQNVNNYRRWRRSQ